LLEILLPGGHTRSVSLKRGIFGRSIGSDAGLETFWQSLQHTDCSSLRINMKTFE
jgi:hypothetical protein